MTPTLSGEKPQSSNFLEILASLFVIFCPFGNFPIFRDFPDLLGDGPEIFPLGPFLFLGLLRAPMRNSPKRVRDTVWTFPDKSGKPPGLEPPRFSFSQFRLCQTQSRKYAINNFSINISGALGGWSGGSHQIISVTSGSANRSFFRLPEEGRDHCHCAVESSSGHSCYEGNSRERNSGEKRREILAKMFAGFRPLISRKSGRKKNDENAPQCPQGTKQNFFTARFWEWGAPIFGVEIVLDIIGSL